MVSEYEFYSLVFEKYLKLEKNLDENQKTYFFQDSIGKLMEVARELNNEVFLQNAMMIISCLYHDNNIDNFESESQDITDLDCDDHDLARSLIKKTLE